MFVRLFATASLSILAVFTLRPVLAVPPSVLAGQEEGEEEKTQPTATADEKYIRDNLKTYLSPDEVEFLDDGRVKMVFDFGKKSEAHKSIFSMKFKDGMKSSFRYTVREEEVVIGGDPGLRVSNAGVALIHAWFVDDVEAEMYFLQHINHKSSHVAAVVFSTDKGRMIGSNYGSQCAYFSRTGRPVAARGKTQPVVFDQTGKIKLVVRGDGVFEAHREGRKKAEHKYKKENFPSGRVGFIWGGSLSGTITRFEVTGRFDAATMAAKMKKALGDE